MIDCPTIYRPMDNGAAGAHCRALGLVPQQSVGYAVCAVVGRYFYWWNTFLPTSTASAATWPDAAGLTLFLLGAALGLSAWRALNRWTIEWVEDNNRRIAYNIHDCFYRHVLTDYGVPDLTSHFCQLDDVLSAGLALSQA